MTERRSDEELLGKLAAITRDAATRHMGGYPDESLIRLADALDAAGVADTVPDRDAPVTDAEVEAALDAFVKARIAAYPAFSPPAERPLMRAALEAARIARMGGDSGD